MTWDNLKPPAPIDGWRMPPVTVMKTADYIEAGALVELKVAKNDSNAIQTDGGWGNPPQDNASHGWNVPAAPAWVPQSQHSASEPPVPAYPLANYSDAETRRIERDIREAVSVSSALMSATTCAGVVNSLAGTKDAFNVDQDGELTRMKEIATGEKPIGYYIAYSNGRWLHSILSGPYNNAFCLDAWGDAVYDLMINDPAYQLAFENKFDRSGIYCAEIPLSAKRTGAYGVLS